MPAKNRKQWKLLWAKADRGEISKKVADEFTHGVDYSKLPEKAKSHTPRKRRRSHTR